MMRGAVKGIAILAAMVLAVQLGCSVPTPPVVQGPGSETVAIRGTIVLTDGSPAPNTLVRAFPASYDPLRDPGLPAEAFDTTDENGQYSFVNLSEGDYHVQALQLQSRQRSLRCGVSVDSADSAILGFDTLAAPGVIKVFLPDSVDPLQGYVYLPGTDRVTLLTESDGFVLLDSVPVGTVPAVVYGEKGGSVTNILRQDVTVVSGDTVVVGNPGWLFSRRIYLNTTPAGADVANAVLDFPVLIRLSGANFDFSQAAPAGVDLRFTKEDTFPLPFEVERWDSATAQAEIWVRLDTVRGNSVTQYLTMYWGNAKSGPVAKAGEVFDTAAGFQGVWHLNQPQGQTVVDATLNGYDGIPSDTAPIAASGVIGPCLRFDGKSTCIKLSNTADSKLNFPENGYYTVSAWVYMEELVDTMTQVIVAKGNEDYFLKMYFGPAGDGPRWEFCEFQEGTGHWINRQPPVTVNAWKLLTGVRQGQQQYLYIDGLLVNDQPTFGLVDTNEHRIDTLDVYIGRFPEYVSRNFQSYCYWDGMIDEVQISSVARGADFVRLSYMNQRPDDRLVEFR